MSSISLMMTSCVRWVGLEGSSSNAVPSKSRSRSSPSRSYSKSSPPPAVQAPSASAGASAGAPLDPPTRRPSPGTRRGRRSGTTRRGFARAGRRASADLAAVHAASLATSLRVRVRVGGGARVRVLRRAGDAQTAETHVGVGRAGGFPVGGLPLPAPLVSASGPANARVAWGRRDGVRRSRGAAGGGGGELNARGRRRGGDAQTGGSRDGRRVRRARRPATRPEA